MNIEKTIEDIKLALKQSDRQIKESETINAVKYWTGFQDALEWLTTVDKREDGFADKE